MEENNSNSIIKIAVVAAIAVILGINVYRTEQCKKEISELSGIVDGEHPQPYQMTLRQMTMLQHLKRKSAPK